jgi:hypothetical protein
LEFSFNPPPTQNAFLFASLLFRIYDERMQTHTWDRVTKLEKGVIYYEGTVKILQHLTGWYGHKVLYFGDHPYSDLADVTLEHGWRTGAIINELTVSFQFNFLEKEEIPSFCVHLKIENKFLSSMRLKH